MAAALPCDMCGAESASLLVTNTANGDTFAVGDACQLTFHLTVAAELAGALDGAGLDAHAAAFSPLITILARHDDTPADAAGTASQQAHDEMITAAETDIAPDTPVIAAISGPTVPADPADQEVTGAPEPPEGYDILGHVDSPPAPAGPAERTRRGASRRPGQDLHPGPRVGPARRAVPDLPGAPRRRPHPVPRAHHPARVQRR